MQLRTAVLSLLPGAAHIDQGRAKRGLVYFALFAFFVNGAAIAPFLAHGWHLRLVCIGAAAVTWLAALKDALGRDRRPAPRREAPAAAPPPPVPAPPPPSEAPHA